MNVRIYVGRLCSYCHAAKRLLEQRKVAYQEIDISELDKTELEQLFQRSGMRTVPQIFYQERCLGGYRELADLDREDHLEFLRK